MEYPRTSLDSIKHAEETAEHIAKRSLISTPSLVFLLLSIPLGLTALVDFASYVQSESHMSYTDTVVVFVLFYSLLSVALISIERSVNSLLGEVTHAVTRVFREARYEERLKSLNS